VPPIGSELADARKAKGLNVADVASRLHIRAMYVDAMERESWDVIGEPVYVRGFLKNYARLVGVRPDDALEELDRHFRAGATNPSGEDNEPVSYGNPPIDRYARDERGAPSIFYPWLLGALTTVAAILVFLVVREFFFPSAEISANQPAVPASNASAAQPGANGLPGSDVQQAAGLNAGDQSSLDQAAQASVQPRGVNLRLVLTQNCWLAVTVDGKRVLYDTLPKGTVREFRAAREITLRAGNAGGVIASVDGQPLGTLGSPGQVQDRVFAAKTNTMGGAVPGE